MFKLSKQWTVAVLRFFFLRKRAVAIIRLVQTATVQYDIWWFLTRPQSFSKYARRWNGVKRSDGKEKNFLSRFFLTHHTSSFYPTHIGCTHFDYWGRVKESAGCSTVNWGRIIHKSPSRLQCQCMRASSQLSASRTNWKAWENTVRKGRYLHILFKCFPRAFQTQMKITGD